MAQVARLILAPLRGLTDSVFRSVYAAHFGGLDGAVAPFVAATGAKASDRLLADLKPERNQGLPVEPQILGNDPKTFLDTALRLARLGYGSVNWNLGCPFPMVARKMRGSGLLNHPGRIDAFLDQVVPDLPLRLSVKMRLGRHDPDEIFTLLPVFDRYPLDAIVIHPRTGIQMYTGGVDLEIFARCLEATRHRVVYNGDIRTLDDFACIAERFHRVEDFMIGRGVLANPFLPSRIRGRSLPVDPVGQLMRFHDVLLEAYAVRLSGPGHLVDRMKGFWRYLARSFADAERVWRRMRRVRDLAAYRDAAQAVFKEANLIGL